MTYRNRKLLDLAHQCPCMAQFPHDCTQYLPVDPPARFAVEAAHSNSSKHGRGKNFKSSDWAIAAMCHTAHMIIDNRQLDGLEDSEWERAHVLTLDYLFERRFIMVAILI